MSTLEPLIVIIGPTASGKTALSIKLAKKFNGEVISADSRQVYRGMDIGTAKITADECGLLRGFTRIIYGGVPHYMIDIVDPNEEFSLRQFKKMAIEIINDIHFRGKLPFLVGGTGLYISAVADNLEIPEIPANKVLRQKLEAKTNEELFQDLKRVDPQMAETIDRNNKRRLIRALEVCILSGRPFSSQRNKGEPLFDILEIGINLPKEKLYEIIEKRLEEQLEAGLEDEVRNLKEKYGRDIPAMSGITYREMCEYLGGEIIFEEAVRKMKSSNKKYAKRQMTWFKRDSRINWIPSKKTFKLIQKLNTESTEVLNLGQKLFEEAQKLIKDFLKNHQA